MAILNEIGRGLSNTGKQVAKKTKEFSDSMQLKSQINAERETINRLYASIGKQVFKEALEEDEKKFFTEFGSIRKSMKKKAELEAELSNIDGCFFCSQCGARIDKRSIFCNRCGARVDKANQAAAEALNATLNNQMSGTKEEEKEFSFVENEIENAAADIAIDIVSH